MAREPQPLPEPGSAEDLGLAKPLVPPDEETRRIEEEGEPFDGNVA